MRVHELQLYRDGNFLEPLTVVTETVQTNSEWLFTHLVEQHNADSVRLKPAEITHQLKALKRQSSVLVVKNTELPILAGLSTADEVIGLINSLLTEYTSVVVCLTLGANLLNNTLPTGRELARFAARLIHGAQLILQLSPLLTGRAKNVSGRFIVAKGPAASGREVQTQQLFYSVKRHVELSEAVVY